MEQVKGGNQEFSFGSVTAVYLSCYYIYIYNMYCQAVG